MADVKRLVWNSDADVKNKEYYDTLGNILEAVTIVLSILILTCMFFNLIMGDTRDIVEVYEEQIRIAQDNSLVETIDESAVEIVHNEISNEDNVKITTGGELTVIYSPDGEIISLKYDSFVVGVAFISIFMGILLGRLIAQVIVTCIIEPYIKRKRTS